MSKYKRKEDEDSKLVHVWASGYVGIDVVTYGH